MGSLPPPQPAATRPKSRFYSGWAPWQCVLFVVGVALIVVLMVPTLLAYLGVLDWLWNFSS